MDNGDTNKSPVVRSIKRHHLCYLLTILCIIINIVGICWSTPALHTSLGKIQRYIDNHIEEAGFELAIIEDPPSGGFEMLIDISQAPFNEETNTTLWTRITGVTDDYIQIALNKKTHNNKIHRTPNPQPQPIWDDVRITWWYNVTIDSEIYTYKLTIWFEYI